MSFDLKEKGNDFCCKFFLEDKKGTDKLISVYWFFILFISAAAVVYMVFIFYNPPYDVRELEANILADNIADCLSNMGRLNSALFNPDGGFNENFKKNFSKNCKITFDTEENWKGEFQYYMGIDFFKVDDTDNPVFEISEGNLNLLSSCELQKEEQYDKLAKCVERRFYSVGKEQYLIKILSIVRKTEKNVK